VYKKKQGVLLTHINARALLKRLKVLCIECEFEKPTQYKLHSFRHHFASMCANHDIAHRKALAWLGHSSSEMLDLYYHLHDEDSQRAMRELAKSHVQEKAIEGNLRATGEYKIVKQSQLPEAEELMECMENDSERVGFEPTLLSQTRFPVVLLRPLGHLSICDLSQ
jgi:Phage integrase family